jgi:hypothetical protein
MDVVFELLHACPALRYEFVTARSSDGVRTLRGPGSNNNPLTIRLTYLHEVSGNARI